MVLFDFRSVIAAFLLRNLRAIDIYFYQGRFFTQERVTAGAVEDRVRGGKSGNDASDLRSFHIFGLFNAFPCDQTVVDCSESE